MRAPARILVLTLALLALGACGFHLRGNVELSPQLTPLYLSDSGPQTLRSEIRANLRGSGVRLSKSRDGAAAVLSIERVSQNRRVLSVDASGRAREYEVRYLLRYRIQRSGQESVARTIQLSRELLFDPDSVLALDYETRTLYTDMQRDAARLLLQQLQALE